MNTYLVTIRLSKTERFSYSAIGAHPCDLVFAAHRTFGICGVTVKPL